MPSTQEIIPEIDGGGHRNNNTKLKSFHTAEETGQSEDSDHRMGEIFSNSTLDREYLDYIENSKN